MQHTGEDNGTETAMVLSDQETDSGQLRISHSGQNQATRFNAGA